MVRTLLKKIKHCLSQDKSVQFAYLHGSFLKRQDARDIDLAVYFKKTQEPWSLAQETAAKLEKTIAYKESIDVHALNDASAAFQFQVLKSGKLFFERDRERRLNWEAHTLSRYQDLKPMLDFHDRQFLNR